LHVLSDRARPAALPRGRPRAGRAAREPPRERDRALRARVTGELREFSGTRPGDTKEPLERQARGGFTRPGERGGARDVEDSGRMGTEIETDPRLLALQGTRPAVPAPSEATP